MLVDTGASLPLLIYTDTDTALTVPPNSIPGNVGRGLGGYLSGYRGRIKSLEFSDFEFGELAGMEIHGILGASFFRQFVIEIDYQNENITFIKPKHFDRKRKRYQKLDVEIFKNKPYLYANMNMMGDSSQKVKLLKTGDYTSKFKI